MTKAIATIIGGNLIPIPDEIGDRLGVGAGHQGELIVEDDGRIAVRSWLFRDYTSEETFGSLPELPNVSHDVDAEIEDGIDESLDEEMKRLERQRLAKQQ